MLDQIERLIPKRFCHQARPWNPFYLRRLRNIKEELIKLHAISHAQCFNHNPAKVNQKWREFEDDNKTSFIIGCSKRQANISPDISLVKREHHRGISRQHLKITFDRTGHKHGHQKLGRIIVEDLNSTKGSFLKHTNDIELLDKDGAVIPVNNTFLEQTQKLIANQQYSLPLDRDWEIFLGQINIKDERTGKINICPPASLIYNHELDKLYLESSMGGIYLFPQEFIDGLRPVKEAGPTQQELSCLMLPNCAPFLWLIVSECIVKFHHFYSTQFL